MATVGKAPTRAGRYITQPTGYRAFMSAPLPPQPALALGGELQGLLSAADRALGRLAGSVLTLPNPDLFVFMYVRKEAVLSSQIEGTQSSLQNLLAAEARLFEQTLPRDVDEVINDVRAMNHGLARLAELPPLVKIALAHVQFETIHPFLGGHGRVGRLLITFLLTERGVLHKPVLYLSHYIKQYRQTYYEHLQAVRNQGPGKRGSRSSCAA